jgi:DNA-binding NtrC family response regulator
MTRKSRILVVDDDLDLRDTLRLALSERGYEVATVATAAEALKAAVPGRFDLVLLDLHLPDRGGLEILRELGARTDGLPIIVFTGDAEMASTVRAMRDGAFDYVSKPLSGAELEGHIDRAIRSRRDAPAAPGTPEPPPRDGASRGDVDGIELVGRSSAMRAVFKHLGLLAASRTTVLVRGESGTGKELAARTLHRFSEETAAQPFMAVNCAALPGPLIEAEVFGYRRGAFTGADSDRAGKLEAAGHGTLFLDEVGEVPLDAQVKLLRVLQERQYERLGETTSRPFHARVIAATHRNLEDLVREGRFREDLYYRLNVATIGLPPLRERREDIRLIAERLLVPISQEVGRPVAGLSSGALELLSRHGWPGNVRELRNVLLRAAVKCRHGTLHEEDLELGSGELRFPEAAAPKPAHFPTLAEAERDLVRRALERTQGHRAKACALLGISRPTLLRKIKRYSLKSADDGPSDGSP